MENVKIYYNQPIDAKAQREGRIQGTGLIGLIAKDQLSPPVNIKLDQSGNIEEWKKATEKRVLSLAQKLGIKNGEKVMDLGSGVGGPARLVEREFSAKIIQINLSHSQLVSSKKLSPGKDVFCINADAVMLPLKDNSLDAVYSINALYHIPDITKVFAEIARTLKPSGLIGIDDWFVTREISPDNLANIREHWSTVANGFHEYNNFLEEAKKQGLRIIEEIDFTKNAGLFFSEGSFGEIYDEKLKAGIKDEFLKLYASSGHGIEDAKLAVRQLREGILKMGELYRNGQAVYKQVVMQKI